MNHVFLEFPIVWNLQVEVVWPTTWFQETMGQVGQFNNRFYSFCFKNICGKELVSDFSCPVFVYVYGWAVTVMVDGE